LRKQSGLPAVPIDEEFLAALEKGLPDCSGVAVGVDRLLMLALQTEQVRDVLSFGFV
jgi:lysyl-tRNA synthetase class 2